MNVKNQQRANGQTPAEEEPTPRSNILIHKYRDRVTIKVGKRIDASAPADSPAGIAQAIVMAAFAALLVPGAFAGLAIGVAAPAWMTLLIPFASFCVVMAFGVWVIGRYSVRPGHDTDLSQEAATPQELRAVREPAEKADATDQ